MDAASLAAASATTMKAVNFFATPITQRIATHPTTLTSPIPHTKPTYTLSVSQTLTLEAEPFLCNSMLHKARHRHN
ncbi:uncharacterized protein Pyn_39826 [Prunus yedoensis var. nudiflora]|uniref:Uncharacterized protein n=1 Tax=Prunus yedoensis var. nudiflora TaxID=2094558 RepID=A0A314UFV6_PRUYE|nr:uncharacterized protein Pyn_39826 [Prunus yedoensis var. nudiflora]